MFLGLLRQERHFCFQRSLLVQSLEELLGKVEAHHARRDTWKKKKGRKKTCFFFNSEWIKIREKHVKKMLLPVPSHICCLNFVYTLKGSTAISQPGGARSWWYPKGRSAPLAAKITARAPRASASAQVAAKSGTSRCSSTAPGCARPVTKEPR